ncbi:FANCL C-terminal domain [Teratosphaeria destructans]|uniref:E3 ubiquitin-protein ligase listerin n=1 Tax=Teratosphaeria destructans TaxID=418781 RepID=A0A9W7W2N1_9PEZI|nr:FANCL C-terminal domain [Teratosphaeria destructans]
MSKKQFKSQASSGRVGGGGGGGGFGALGSSGFGSTQSSSLSYIQEPLDYSSVSNANLVVSLKNLSKKDSTTKAKALEDIQAYVSSSGIEVEEGLLEAWVKLYPRLSIDSARRVRQLAHALNGHICSKCGKRVARHLPRIAGPWLAGTYDSDRAAGKGAQDAFAAVFPTPEKVRGVKKAFHESILQYCRDAVLHETVKTLSDERTISSDDAGATYARVVGTSLAVVNSLVCELPGSEINPQQHVYEELFGDQTFWNFSTNGDIAVRRAMHQLVQSALERQPHLVGSNLHAASTAYIYKGLPSDQTGSSTDFARTLTSLTSRFESIWTEAYSAKKPPASRLKHFLKHGSRSGTAAFWEVSNVLFSKIPQAVLPRTLEDAKEVLHAARDGVASRGERFNASAAWPAYFTFVDRVGSGMSSEDREKLLDTCVLPIIRQYLQPSPDTAEWTVSGAKPASLVANASSIDGVVELLGREWSGFADRLIETAKLSQPQQSKEFEKSQLHVASTGQRWAALQKQLFARIPESAQATFLDADIKVMTEAAGLLKTRDGKPYGAAAIIEELVKSLGPEATSDADFIGTLQDLLQANDSSWVLWPSSRYLVRCLFAMHNQQFFGPTYERALRHVVEQQQSEEITCKLLLDLLPHNAPEDAVSTAKADAQLQYLVENFCRPGLDTLKADVFLRLHQLGAMPVETSNRVFSGLITSLADSHSDTELSKTLDFFVSLPDSVLRGLPGSVGAEQLLPNLLHLEQHADDELAQKAAALSTKLSGSATEANGEAIFGVVLQNLERLSIKSLSADALQDLLSRVLGPDGIVENVADALPSLETWTKSIQAVVRKPKSSLALLGPIGDALHLVQSDVGQRSMPVHVDADGLSQALRIAIYVAEIMRITEKNNGLTDLEVDRWNIISLLYLTTLLAEDNLSLLATNALWDPTQNVDAEPQVLAFVTLSNAVLAKQWDSMVPDFKSDSSDYAHLFTALDRLGHGQPVDSPIRYYIALASAKINANLFENHGYNVDQTTGSEAVLKQRRTENDAISTAACVAGLRQPLAGSQILNRYCNELVAELTDLDISDEQHARKRLEQLVILSIIFSTQDDAVGTVAKQRLIFLVKRLLPALNAGITNAMKAAILKVLTKLLPGMQDMYGDHWTNVLAFITSYWSSVEADADAGVDEDRIVLTNASLRLYATLRKLADSDEPNDDLVDALKESKDQAASALIALLKASNGTSDETHQPLMVTHELLAREISRLPQHEVHDADELYPLLYTPSHPVQQAAFNLLHKHIPPAQEQISFDAALDNKTAHLPDELLSLILEAPTLDSLVDASFDRTMPLPLQGYLYGWRLLFDHFTSSSYRVKTDYIDQLKDGTYLSGLLSFTFDFLGHSRGKPIDASKFDIAEYVPDAEPNPERDVQWLLTHLYYLALTHLPSLVKSYYLDVRSRQTSLAVESWTAKYISPLIINASLQAVAEWSEKSVKEDPDYEKMSVKVGMRSKEIGVSYVVDEQTMAIKVVLPETYPLASADVIGVSRVAVKEEKWQSWLRNCRGVITFSNGSITDGLSAWRKNVTGALKGQTECAICYSIIDSQKQLPTKRCPTCKHLFHGSCLFKWFKTSNASTCPLCRNAFNFNG